VVVNCLALQFFVQTSAFALLYLECKSFALSGWERGKFVQILLRAYLIELMEMVFLIVDVLWHRRAFVEFYITLFWIRHRVHGSDLVRNCHFSFIRAKFAPFLYHLVDHVSFDLS